MKPSAHRALLAITLATLTQANTALAAGIDTGSTINTTNAHAYGANIGWINLRGDTTNGVRVGEYFLSGYAYGANVGWISFGDGSPANGHAYANTSAADCGVNQSGFGTLSGYAYGANIGWIHFGWAALNDPNRPAFNLTTGAFSGYVYGANVGWINLGAGYLRTDTLLRHDTDTDNIDDAWEMQWFSNLTTASIGTDSDHDGATDAAEAIADTDPTDYKNTLRVTSHTYASGLTQVTIQFASSPARLYRLEYSTTLTTWTDSSLGTFSPDSGAYTTRTITVPASTRAFFRAIAVEPLP